MIPGSKEYNAVVCQIDGTRKKLESLWGFLDWIRKNVYLSNETVLQQWKPDVLQ